ncbi:conserved hypothetical protein [delta proteobacterium NaphS2]|nr:conserved hypothetical protein [delta proteobacterium NaphS2]
MRVRDDRIVYEVRKKPSLFMCWLLAPRRDKEIYRAALNRK